MANTKTDNSQNNKNQITETPVVINDKITQTVNEQQKTTNSREEVETIKQQKILNRHTLFLTVFTAVQILVNILMWHQVGKQTEILDSTLVQTKRSINISDNMMKESRDANDSSDNFNRQTIGIAYKGLKVTEKNIAINEEISKIAIQPYLYLNIIGSTKNFEIGKEPYIDYEIINGGKTPAYKVIILLRFNVEYDFRPKELNDIHTLPDTIGYFLASDQSEPLRCWWGENLDRASYDSVMIGQQAIHFLCTIIYEDAFGYRHYTQVGSVESPKTGGMQSLRKYFRTDHDEKTKTDSSKARKTTNR